MYICPVRFRTPKLPTHARAFSVHELQKKLGSLLSSIAKFYVYYIEQPKLASRSNMTRNIGNSKCS